MSGMTTDGVFSIHAMRVPCRRNDYVTLIPFGDVHHDSPSHAKEVWEQFRSFCRKAHNPVYIGIGDYLDSFSASERRIVHSRDLHDSTLIRMERETRKRVEQFAKEISFMRGRLIGLLGGNHFPVLSGDLSGDQYLAHLMDAPYLGTCSAIRLTLVDSKKSDSVVNLDVFAHHGRGGGATTGGRLNAVDKMRHTFLADIYLMGHDHSRGCMPCGDRLMLDHDSRAGLRVVSRQQWLGRTGSFLKSYDQGMSSYVVDRALPPASLGWISFQIRFRRDRNGNTERVSPEIRAEQ